MKLLNALKLDDVRKLDYVEQKRICNMLISKIEVTEDEIKIHWIF